MLLLLARAYKESCDPAEEGQLPVTMSVSPLTSLFGQDLLSRLSTVAGCAAQWNDWSIYLDVTGDFTSPFIFSICIQNIPKQIEI